MGFDFHIVGAGRGGTSLLSGLIDAHPDCTVVTEIYSTPLLMGSEWTDAESHSSPQLRVSGRIGNFLRACEADGAASPTKLWGHKTTTEHIRGLRLMHADDPLANDSEAKRQAEAFDYVGCFVAATQHIPTIFIQRDGRTCIRSKINRTKQSLDQAIANWKFSVQVLHAYRRSDAKLLVVKMEDLVSMPEGTLALVCDFLGVAYTPVMLSGTLSEKILPEYRRPNFDVSVLAHDNPPWTEAIRDELVACGYAL